MRTVKENEICIIIGDFNPKVRRDSLDGIVGRYELGKRNEYVL